MKIAFLSFKDPALNDLDADGGAVTPRHYALELGKRGHKVDVFTPRILASGAHNPYLEAKCKAQIGKEQYLSENVKVVRLPIKTVNRDGLTTRETKDLSNIIESVSFADSFEEGQLDSYDVVSLFHPLAAYGVMNRRLTNPRTTVLFPMLLSDYYMKYQSLSEAYCELERVLLSGVGHICSPSNDEKNVLIEKGIPEEKITVIHRGLDVDVFYPRTRTQNSRMKEGKVTVACANAIRPQKSQHQLVHIAELLKADDLEPEISIIGENKRFYKKEHEEYYRGLQALIKDARLRDNFKFLGAVCPGRVADTLRDADLAIYPSETESFGKSILEAIATGTPTIVYDDIPAYGEFIKPSVNALTVPRKPEDIAKAVRLLVDDKELYHSLSTQGVATAKEFTWETVTEDLEQMYLNVISEI